MAEASPTPPPGPEPDDEEAQPLDAKDRYRALNAAMDEAYELIDIGNREARFALILMGGLNASVLVASGSVQIDALPPDGRIWLGALFLVYLAVALYFMLQAIEALRPGRFRPQLGNWPKDRRDYPKGIRYFEDVITHDAESYWQAWHEVTMGQLNAELAVQVHSLCIKNNYKRLALRKLYSGLRIMTLLLGSLVSLYLYFVWR